MTRNEQILFQGQGQLSVAEEKEGAATASPANAGVSEGSLGKTWWLPPMTP